MSAYCLLSYSHSFVTLYFALMAPEKIPRASTKCHAIKLEDKLVAERISYFCLARKLI